MISKLQNPELLTIDAIHKSNIEIDHIIRIVLSITVFCTLALAVLISLLFIFVMGF